MTYSLRAALQALLACCIVLAAACRTAPPGDLDLALGKMTVHMHYRVTLVPPAVQPRINELHSWQVRVTTAAGSPVHTASFVIGGGMPQHGHGFPTQPRITREVGDGVYLLEGMKFSMTGWWQIRLAITASTGPDEVVFNTVVSKPGVATTAATSLRDKWTAQELEILASMRLPQVGTRRVDASNRHERDAGAAQLGQALFEDKRLSANGEVSCSSCHPVDRGFQDDTPVARGMGTGQRRTMPVMGASGAPFLFWDGRKDSLWSQALGPIEDPAEHGFNRARAATLIATQYREQYEQVFGQLPAQQAVALDASPLGNEAERAAWHALPPRRQEEINTVFANLGKAIAAYEVRVDQGTAPFDRYIDATLAGNGGGQASLSPQQVSGLRLFMGKAQCSTCHNGPLLTDHAFHNTGVPPRGAVPDLGRAQGVQRLLADEFNCLGKYSDATPGQCGELRFISTEDPRLLGAFRTPGLRDVARRPPYMHAGQFDTLEQVVAHYASSPPAVVGRSELARPGDSAAERKPIRLTAVERAQLVAFLKALQSGG